MKTQQYSDISGLDLSTTQVVAPQTNFIHLNNFFPSSTRGEIFKRSGTRSYTATGDGWGVFGYRQIGASPKVPVTEYTIRHRRSGGTSYIEKYSWTSDTWSAFTLGANTSFDVGDVARAAQVGSLLAICGGTPAKLTDPDSGSILRLGGPAPTAAPTVAAGAAGALTGTYYYVYTFYNSTTGWESSPSPISAVVSPSSKKVDISAMQTTCAKEGVDKKRIYRTITTGEPPYMRVAEITLATTTYTDDIADASLGASAPDIGDHNPPPVDSYIVESHLSRIWIAKGDTLHYSLPYAGSTTALEYFSDEREIPLPSYITGLASTSNGALYVFCPPGFGIWELRGRTEADFELVPFMANEGTNFPSSIAKNNEQFCYWGAQGPRLVRGDYLVPTFGDGVRPLLDEYTAKDYSEVFVWAQFYSKENQFIFGFGGTIDDVGGWLLDAGGDATWENAETGESGSWEETP